MLCVGLCISVRKTHKSLSSSLPDFGQLHNTLKRILDGLWLLFVVLSEIVFGFDAFTILAPLLTLILAASFAIGPVIGNLFMAIGHVLFFLNYDVGDRIAINIMGDKRMVVDVQQITLVSTIGITMYKEQVHSAH
jgi:small-conductance mechanosensitive channel